MNTTHVARNRVPAGRGLKGKAARARKRSIAEENARARNDRAKLVSNDERPAWQDRIFKALQGVR